MGSLAISDYDQIMEDIRIIEGESSERVRAMETEIQLCERQNEKEREKEREEEKGKKKGIHKN